MSRALLLLFLLPFALQAQTFTEVGASAGVDDAGNGTGTAWGDYDNDGDLDLYLANYGTNRLYRNNGDGTFTEVGSSAGVNDGGNGTGVSWGDYDNDGDLDLYLANAGTNRLYRNNNNGTFTEVGSSGGVNDGGTGQGVSWGDYDNDGDLDLYLANHASANRLYRNNNNGTFTEVGSSAGVNDTGNGRGVSWGDYDNDGDLDLYLANENQANRLYRNNNNGTFTEVGSSAGVNDSGFGLGVAWGDYDNDGDLDLYLVNYGGTNRLFKNNGNGTFTEVGASAGVNDSGAGHGVAWGDYDTDGDLDLYVTNNSGANRLYQNNGNGTFTEVGASTGVNDAGPGYSASWGDYDNDGDLDLYLANFGSANRLFRNNGNANRWLIVKTVGTSSNKDGIGAKVMATTGATTQRRDVDGGSGFDSQPSLPVEFGFGSTTTVDQLTITWPSGNTNTLTSVATNQTITVTELATPTLSSPADAATGQAISLTLSWNAVTGATSYRLQVSTVSNFASTVFDNAALAGTSQAVGPLSYNTTYYWRVRANNANSASAYSTTRNFTTVSNTAPVATAQTVTGNEDADLAITLAGTDADGQSLSALISTLPANGSLYQTADGTTRGAQITNVPTTVTDASKRVIYTPPANGNGAGHGNFGFKVNDGLVDSPEATVTVNVTAINDAPTLAAIANPSAILEDAGAQTVNLSGISSGVANETQVLTVTATSSNTVLIPHPTVTYTSPNATGSMSYTPVSQASGTATITVTVTDDGGTANGGVSTVSQSFTVTVTPVNTVASFVMSHHNPVRAGDGLELSVSFRNPFGRTVPYTGTVRLAVEGGGIGGAGAQSVSGVTAAVFPLQTQVFRTADGAMASIPFTLTVEGVGSQSGTFQVRSRFLVPALGLPAVEVRRGEEWVPFEQFAFVGGRSEQLRVRNLNAVRLRAYVDLSYLRAGESGQPTPALLLEREVWLDPGAVHPFELHLPLYLYTAEGSGRLRL